MNLMRRRAKENPAGERTQEPIKCQGVTAMVSDCYSSKVYQAAKEQVKSMDLENPDTALWARSGVWGYLLTNERGSVVEAKGD